MLLLARDAPRVPEVDDDGLAREVGERRRALAVERREVERRRRLAEQVAALRVRCGSLPTLSASTTAERDDDDARPRARSSGRGASRRHLLELGRSGSARRRVRGVGGVPARGAPAVGSEREDRAERHHAAADPEPQDHRVDARRRASPACVVRRRHQREVHVLDGGRCAPTACRCPGAVRERGDRRRVDAEVAVAPLDPDAGRDGRLLADRVGVRAEIRERVARDRRRLAAPQADLAAGRRTPTTPRARPRSARRRSARRARRRGAGSTAYGAPSATAPRLAQRGAAGRATPSTNWRTMPAVANAPSPNASTSATPRAPSDHRDDHRRRRRPTPGPAAGAAAPRRSSPATAAPARPP